MSAQEQDEPQEYVSLIVDTSYLHREAEAINLIRVGVELQRALDNGDLFTEAELREMRVDMLDGDIVRGWLAQQAIERAHLMGRWGRTPNHEHADCDCDDCRRDRGR
jgi:hypothetical protein